MACTELYTAALQGQLEEVQKLARIAQERDVINKVRPKQNQNHTTVLTLAKPHTRSRPPPRELLYWQPSATLHQKTALWQCCWPMALTLALVMQSRYQLSPPNRYRGNNLTHPTPPRQPNLKPLHIAAENGHSQSVAHLVLEDSSALLVRDLDGRTPEDCAREAHHYDIAAALHLWLRQERRAALRLLHAERLITKSFTVLYHHPRVLTSLQYSRFFPLHRLHPLSRAPPLIRCASSCTLPLAGARSTRCCSCCQ